MYLVSLWISLKLQINIGRNRKIDRISRFKLRKGKHNICALEIQTALKFYGLIFWLKSQFCVVKRIDDICTYIKITHSVWNLCNSMKNISCLCPIYPCRCLCCASKWKTTENSYYISINSVRFFIRFKLIATKIVVDFSSHIREYSLSLSQFNSRDIILDKCQAKLITIGWKQFHGSQR